MSIRAVEWALTRKVGNAYAKVVLICLANNADDETFECWPSVGYVAERCELSERTVYRVVHFLVEQGLIKVEKRRWPGGVRRTPKYTLLGVVSIRHHSLSGEAEGSATGGSRRTVTEPSLRTEARVFVVVGTDAWSSWERHYREKKLTVIGKPPKTQHNGEWGWWFPSEFPQ